MACSLESLGSVVAKAAASAGDELFIRHHAIVARRQQPIHAFQTEGLIKRDGFARCPYHNRYSSVS